MRQRSVTIGTQVQIVGPPADSTLDPKFLTKIGTIRKIEKHTGVGSTPADPFYIIAFRGVGTDGFWREEFKVL